MVKVPAAWLIEQAGFPRGYQRGGAAISNKHTLALVNRGGATAGEMLDLCREIRDRVEARFLITLQPEPVFIGFGGVAEQTGIPA
jgi:UDP-N-acetylmuramate dehydrogenase